MLQIKLINMPFADVSIPSIALTQLKAVTESTLGKKVAVEIIYLNHEFGRYFGLDHYRVISNGAGSNNSGFGDWFFRQVAFPEEPDNTTEYLERYGHLLGLEYLRTHGEMLLEKRANLPSFFAELIRKYDLANSDLVGFTSLFMQQVGIIGMARAIKKIRPSTITLIGGANCETPMGEHIASNVDVIDYVFSGAALVSFPTLVTNILNGDTSANESINGIFTRNNCMRIAGTKAKITVRQDGGVETTGPIGDEMPINNCVPLDYDSFLSSFDALLGSSSSVKPYLLFETSRGCWWGAKAHCTFCGLNGGGMSYRALKSEYAISMLNGLFTRYGDRIKHFSCVDNIIPKEYIREVFPFLNRPKDASMFYEVKADLTTEEMKVLSEAGVVEMQPGIEALSTSTLKLMKKGTTSFNNIRFLQNAVRFSITPHWNLLIGFPGEEESVYSRYFDFLPLLFHLPPPQGVFPVRFDRYSPYFNEAEKYKLDLHPLDYYNLIYPFPKQVLAQIAYYFSDHNYDSDYMKYTARWVKKLESRVAEWQSRWKDVEIGVFPQLYFVLENDEYVVIDSRQAQTRKVNLSLMEFDILKNLVVRKNIEGICAQMPDKAESEIRSIVSKLESELLLFEEHATYMSLVFDERPILKRNINFH